MAQRASLEPVRAHPRIPPHNLDAEQSILGAMLESKEAIANVIEIVKADDFYKPAHTEIYETILELYGRGERPDAVTIAEELNRRGSLESIGGKPYIHGLLEAYPTASSAAGYARIVEEHALLRRLIEAGNEVADLGFSMPEDVADAVDRAEEIVYQVGDRRLRDDVMPIRPLLTENMEAIEQLYERGEHLTGLGSGFTELDEKTLGFQPSNLVIIAARPSMGKSALLGDFALHAAVRQKSPVVIFSLEMSRNEIVQRFLSSEAKVDSQRIRKGSLQEQDWARLSNALGRLHEAPVFIDDSASISLMEMRAKCRRLKAKHGLGLIIIDYLQLMQSPRKSENRNQEVSEISRALKIMARELQVPVLCASQLNRAVEQRADKRPLLGDLRESGCLSGETLVTLASGEQRAIRELVGTTPDVATLDGWKMKTAPATKVWLTAHREVFKMRLASGRVVRATDNHRFKLSDRWEALGTLRPGDRIAIPSTPIRAAHPARPLAHAGASGSGFSVRSGDDVLAGIHVDWDEIVSIEPDGHEDVYDMTVPGTHNFIANDIVAHNSIEQDADLVMFLYRDEFYNPETEHRGEAELILAKHRNGPTGTVHLAFMNQYTKFASIARGPQG